jgi:hypothetical protein
MKTTLRKNQVETPPVKLAYSMREAAAVLGVSYITVHHLCKRGLLRSSGALRNKIFSHVELERFLRDTQQAA